MSNQTSTVGWRGLALGEIIVFIAMVALAANMKVWPPIWMQWLTAIFTVVTVFICLKVTEGKDGKPDNSENWKAYAGFIAIIISIIVYAIPISIHSVK